MLRYVVWLCYFQAVLAAEWNCVATSGVFTLSSNCMVSSQVEVSGSLYITGVPDTQGALPKITGGGSNRFFNVASGGELVMKYLNLTGGGTDDYYGAAILSISSKLSAESCIFYKNIDIGNKVVGGVRCVYNR